MTNQETNNEECIRLFCKTLAELNAISLAQMEGLLNLAASAAENLNSNGGDGAQFVDELKTAAADLSRQARAQEEEIYRNVKETLSSETKHSFCETVEQKIVIALENSLANQQQLNITGDAILAQAASMLLSGSQ
jgi:hypothetical protein